MGGAYNWPSLAEVIQYRQQVRKTVLDVIDSTPLQLPVTPDHQWVNN